MVVRRFDKHAMKHTRTSSTQNLLRIATALLAGAVFGISGFALWAEHAGVWMAGPLFNVLFPIGLCAGMFAASLPLVIGEMLTANRRMNSTGRRVREMLDSIRAELTRPPERPIRAV